MENTEKRLEMRVISDPPDEGAVPLAEPDPGRTPLAN